MRAAWVYAALTGVICAFHLAMAAGAPWGHLTMGGRWPGVLPPEGRLTALVSVVILAGLALVVLARAGVLRIGVLRIGVPGWAIWGVVAYLAIAVVLHVITPSAAERALWLPVILVMLVCALVVARQRSGTPRGSGGASGE